MHKMKKIILGQVVLVLMACCHYKHKMTDEERRDFADLEQCANILSEGHNYQFFSPGTSDQRVIDH